MNPVKEILNSIAQREGIPPEALEKELDATITYAIENAFVSGNLTAIAFCTQLYQNNPHYHVEDLIIAIFQNLPIGQSSLPPIDEAAESCFQSFTPKQ